MAEVKYKHQMKLKQEMERWEPWEHTHSEEPKLSLKQEPHELPFHTITMKTEDDDDESSELHQKPTEEDRKQTEHVEDREQTKESREQTEHPEDRGEQTEHAEDRGEQTEHAEDRGEQTGAWVCAAAAGAGCSSDPLTLLHSDSDDSEPSVHWDLPVSTDPDLDFSVGTVGSKGKPCSCSVCGKEFLRCGDLNRHLLIHTEHKPFECAVCGRCFRRKNTLKTHMLVHTGEKPFFCSVCEKGFAYKQTFDKHRCIPPAVEAMRPYSCSECGRRFLSSSNLKTHMFVHTDERPQKCHVCNTVFKHKSSLERHLKVQHNILSPKKPAVPKPPERPLEVKTAHKCSECGKEFPRQYCLKRHMMSHSGEKPCSCPVCGLRLASKTNVKIHMATHSSEKHFRCPFCDKGFTQDSSMKRHMAVHT